MLISSAILSLTFAVGVGFLLNSISSVESWSCVARWRFWFFCCWVRVLLRGGRLDGLAEAGPLVVEADGEGVCFNEAALAEPGAVEPGLDESATAVAAAMACSISVAIVGTIAIVYPIAGQGGSG